MLRAHGTVTADGGARVEVDLDLRPGEVVAMVGPNGAGKSLTLAGLLGMLPFDGSLLLHGVDRSRAPVHQRGFGWAPQVPALLPRRRVAGQIDVFRTTAAPLSRDAVVATLGLTGLLGHRPDELSVGQAQRVQVARALAVGQVVLLDEPTSAQDPTNAIAVRAAVRAHAAAGGTALVVAHRSEDAALAADRLVVVEDGRVVQKGTPQALAADPASAFVARAVGAVVLHGDLTHDEDGWHVRGPWGALAVVAPPAAEAGTRAAAIVRPHVVTLFRRRPVTTSARNLLRGNVTTLRRRGDDSEVVMVSVSSEPALVAQLTASAVRDLELAVGVEVWAAVKASEVLVAAE